ncbi:MAG: superoxide dismutase [Patescibacteria group bacterium]|nr:superoxide dismutase [Patescibacteria group bacterium]
MKKSNFFSLPKLEYGYDDLWPYMTEEQLRTHHQKHHQGYVNKSNALLKKLDKARKNGANIDLKDVSKALSFNIGGHVLHTIFWENLKPAKEKQKIPKKVEQEIKKEFGSVENFKREFTQVAKSVEGSGWASLVYSKETDRLLCMQVEKHNYNLLPSFKILMVIDVWEHAYYIDYRNDRARFVDSFWEIVNWQEVDRRLDKVKK